MPNIPIVPYADSGITGVRATVDKRIREGGFVTTDSTDFVQTGSTSGFTHGTLSVETTVAADFSSTIGATASLAETINAFNNLVGFVNSNHAVVNQITYVLEANSLGTT